MGRAFRIEKKMSHITVVVEEYEGEKRIKPHGSKAKARPSFAGLAKAAAKKKKATEEKPEETIAAATADETIAEVTEQAEAVAPVEETPAAEAPAEETPAKEDSTETEPNAESDKNKPGEA